MILGQIRKQINIQLAVKKERLRKGLADAFTIQKIEHKDVVKLFKTQLINLKRFAKFTDVKLLIAWHGCRYICRDIASRLCSQCIMDK